MRTKEFRNAFSFEIPFQVESQDKITRTAFCIKGVQNKTNSKDMGEKSHPPRGVAVKKYFVSTRYVGIR